MTVLLAPVVGYAGGKRRLLPRLRPLFPVDKIRIYVEPFVGMGALYLDLRARGYEGPSVLADSNPSVAEFWRLLHGAQADEVVRCAEDLAAWPLTPDHFFEVKRTPVKDPVARCATFLWLCHYSFGNQPPRYDGTWRGRGSKLSSAARWGKRFPWRDVTARLRMVVSRLRNLPCKVHENGIAVIDSLKGTEHVYADPPYEGTERYGTRPPHGYVGAVLRANAGHVVLSETRVLDVPAGWKVFIGNVTARQSARRGAQGVRQEFLYARIDTESRAQLHLF